jgi:hypothetical protein
VSEPAVDPGCQSTVHGSHYLPRRLQHSHRAVKPASAAVTDNNAVAPKFPRLSERLHFASLQRKYPLKSSPPQSNLLLRVDWSGLDQAAQFPKWPMLQYRNKCIANI